MHKSKNTLERLSKILTGKTIKVQHHDHCYDHKYSVKNYVVVKLLQAVNFLINLWSLRQRALIMLTYENWCCPL